MTGEFLIQDGKRVVQTHAVLVRDAPEPAGRVLMEEEVFATWIATSLILAVMGTQFTSRVTTSDTVRISIDIVTMSIATLVLLWAGLAYFGVLSHKSRAPILLLILCLILALYITVIAFVAQKMV